MILWLDAQISPRLCLWIARRFAVDAVPVRALGLREAEDPEIFDEIGETPKTADERRRAKASSRRRGKTRRR